MSDFTAASKLLQDAALNRVPGRITDAIIARHGLDTGRRESIRTALRDLGTHVSSNPEGFVGSIEAFAQWVERASISAGAAEPT